MFALIVQCIIRLKSTDINNRSKLDGNMYCTCEKSWNDPIICFNKDKSQLINIIYAISNISICTKQ